MLNFQIYTKSRNTNEKKGLYFMRRILVRCLKLGSTIATDVYDSNFRVLVKKYSVIDEKIIEDLEKCKVISV